MGNGIPPQKEEKNVGDAVDKYKILEAAAENIWEMVSSQSNGGEGVEQASAKLEKIGEHIVDLVSNFIEDNWVDRDIESKSKEFMQILEEVACHVVGKKGADRTLVSVVLGKGVVRASALEQGNTPGRVNDESKGLIDELTPEELSKLTPEQLKESLPEGWTYNESPDGRFIHIKDEKGNYRVRVDSPDTVTKYPHMHIFDKDGKAIDINGKIVPPKSPDAHIPR